MSRWSAHGFGGYHGGAVGVLNLSFALGMPSHARHVGRNIGTSHGEIYTYVVAHGAVIVTVTAAAEGGAVGGAGRRDEVIIDQGFSVI